MTSYFTLCKNACLSNTHTGALFPPPLRSATRLSLVVLSRWVTLFPDAVSALAPRVKFLRSPKHRQKNEYTPQLVARRLVYIKSVVINPVLQGPRSSRVFCPTSFYLESQFSDLTQILRVKHDINVATRRKTIS